MKEFFPKGAAWDILNLAEALLGQAMIGPSPDPLILSYLKYAISSQMVSCSSVLTAIRKFDDFSQDLCVQALLGIMDMFSGGYSGWSQQPPAPEPGRAAWHALIRGIPIMLSVHSEQLHKTGFPTIHAVVLLEGTKNLTELVSFCCDLLVFLICWIRSIYNGDVEATDVNYQC
ncbi:Mediator of RNA polymerase II transcription subunit 24 [Camelus dromedarius]|uniref:Mediator of RNA polymerase II transcription subunit 24 n=1 Tax=Camelus dromedarius TaxID=9838 RepID=A0A5N4D0A9_CAMDR|nr:Mediator of RNA polymerase II transcription subunit 24 [Camelus dromedarius]